MGRRPSSRTKKAQQPDLFEVGDELFFVMGNGTLAGEGLYIGHAPGNTNLVVLAKQGMPGTELDAADCRPTGHKDANLGHQLRQAHLKRLPGTKQFRRNYAVARTDSAHDGIRKYRASQKDCRTCELKSRCCPNMPSRNVQRFLLAAIAQNLRRMARLAAAAPD
jgi:hypothetical protein